jgi:hypothetical protein
MKSRQLLTSLVADCSWFFSSPVSDRCTAKYVTTPTVAQATVSSVTSPAISLPRSVRRTGRRRGQDQPRPSISQPV